MLPGRTALNVVTGVVTRVHLESKQRPDIKAKDSF